MGVGGLVAPLGGVLSPEVVLEPFSLRGEGGHGGDPAVVSVGLQCQGHEGAVVVAEAQLDSRDTGGVLDDGPQRDGLAAQAGGQRVVQDSGRPLVDHCGWLHLQAGGGLLASGRVARGVAQRVGGHEEVLQRRRYEQRAVELRLPQIVGLRGQSHLRPECRACGPGIQRHGGDPRRVLYPSPHRERGALGPGLGDGLQAQRGALRVGHEDLDIEGGVGGAHGGHGDVAGRRRVSGQHVVLHAGWLQQRTRQLDAPQTRPPHVHGDRQPGAALHRTEEDRRFGDAGRVGHRGEQLEGLPRWVCLHGRGVFHQRGLSVGAYHGEGVALRRSAGRSHGAVGGVSAVSGLEVVLEPRAVHCGAGQVGAIEIVPRRQQVQHLEGAVVGQAPVIGPHPGDAGGVAGMHHQRHGLALRASVGDRLMLQGGAGAIGHRHGQRAPALGSVGRERRAVGAAVGSLEPVLQLGGLKRAHGRGVDGLGALLGHGCDGEVVLASAAPVQGHGGHAAVVLSAHAHDEVIAGQVGAGRKQRREGRASGVVGRHGEPRRSVRAAGRRQRPVGRRRGVDGLRVELDRRGPHGGTGEGPGPEFAPHEREVQGAEHLSAGDAVVHPHAPHARRIAGRHRHLHGLPLSLTVRDRGELHGRRVRVWRRDHLHQRQLADAEVPGAVGGLRLQLDPGLLDELAGQLHSPRAVALGGATGEVELALAAVRQDDARNARALVGGLQRHGDRHARRPRPLRQDQRGERRCAVRRQHGDLEGCRLPRLGELPDVAAAVLGLQPVAHSLGAGGHGGARHGGPVQVLPHQGHGHLSVGLVVEGPVQGHGGHARGIVRLGAHDQVLAQLDLRRCGLVRESRALLVVGDHAEAEGFGGPGCRQR